MIFPNGQPTAHGPTYASSARDRVAAGRERLGAPALAEPPTFPMSTPVTTPTDSIRSARRAELASSNLAPGRLTSFAALWIGVGVVALGGLLTRAAWNVPVDAAAATTDTLLGAACLLLAGTGLFFCGFTAWWRRWPVIASAVALFIVTVARLWLIATAALPPLPPPTPGAGAAPTAMLQTLCFALLAIVLVLHDWTRRSPAIRWSAAIAVTFVTAAGTLDASILAYDVLAAHGTLTFSAAAFWSAVGLLLLGLGHFVLWARSVDWTMAVARATPLCFGIAGLLLIALGGFTERTVRAFSTTSAAVARNYQIQAEVGLLQRSIIDALIARRGLTPDASPERLGPFRAAIGQARAHLATLATLSRDDAEQQMNIAKLEQLLAPVLARAATLGLPAATPAPSDRASASSGPTTISGNAAASAEHTAAAARSENTNDALLRLLGAIVDRERTRVHEFQQQADRAFHAAEAVIPAGTLLCVLLLTTGFLMLNQEACERRAAQEELQRFNLELEKRVCERTAALDDANKELEAFSYSVSHDLRAPLRHIHGFTAMLEDAAGDRLGEESSRYVQVISNSCNEMARLIDDLLDFSRVGRQELHKGTVNLSNLVSDSVRAQELALKDRDVTWKIAPLPIVRGDAAMLRRVFDNLIGNAVKYTRKRPQATIEVGTHDGEPGEVVIYVRDNGAGFDMAHAQKLFGVFERLHRDDEFEGTGIGLAIVRRVITRHGGKVWADAKVGEGAAFYFTLQRA